MFQDPLSEVSAHFLYPKVGKPVQMVDSGDPAWHAGNYLANLHYHGFEFEGGPPGNLSEPLTANQIAWGVKVTHWLRDVHNTPLIYVRRDTLWEHNEVKNTACPSGRIPWLRIIQALKEDDMQKDLLSHKASGQSYVLDGPYKVHVGPAWLTGLKAMGYTYLDLTDKEIEGIQERPSATGRGATPDQVVDRFKARL
jgi:hypothetical protein